MSNDLMMIFFVRTKGPHCKKYVLSQPQPWLSLGFILSLSAFPSNQWTTDGTKLKFHVLPATALSTFFTYVTAEGIGSSVHLTWSSS